MFKAWLYITYSKLCNILAVFTTPSPDVNPVINGTDVMAVQGLTVRKASSTFSDSMDGGNGTGGSISHS